MGGYGWTTPGSNVAAKCGRCKWLCTSMFSRIKQLRLNIDNLINLKDCLARYKKGLMITWQRWNGSSHYRQLCARSHVLLIDSEI